MEDQYVVTAIAPVNIATIKYWGKRDEQLILPLNDSLSVTLSTNYMCAKTTVAISPNFTEDRIWLNGKEESIQNPRLQNCLKNIRKLARIPIDQLHWNVHICSENNFPTAAGLASSSAGYACLGLRTGILVGMKTSDLFRNIRTLLVVSNPIGTWMKQGSGSACRSMYGGFVRWYRGDRDDGLDSIAVQLFPAVHWPELRVLILVVNDKQKKTSSTTGMQRSVETSMLLQHRINNCVESHAEKMVEAIRDKDFEAFAEITIRDSNQFHAVCLDTYPPAVYMNDTSHTIASFVHQFNSAIDCSKVTYTYDAGPNACLFALEEDVPMVIAAIEKSFPTTLPREDYFKGIPLDFTKKVDPPVIDIATEPNCLKYIIYTTVGDGPKLLPLEDRLINEDGFPLTYS